VQALRQGHASGVDADQRKRGEVIVLLDDLVGDPANRPLDLLAGEQLALGQSRRHGH
jgi:hypothetical protein